MSIQSINPATGAFIAAYEEMDRRQAEAAVERAHEAFLEWRCKGFPERASRMRTAGYILHDRAAEFARLMAEEVLDER